MSNTEERQKIREFWLQLGEDERRSLVKVEKEAVLRKMKEQQKHSCNCSVCGKKRTAIEDELEVLYDAYYEELEQYANHQQQTRLYSESSPLDYPDGSFDHDTEDEAEDADDDEEEDYDGEYEDEDDGTSEQSDISDAEHSAYSDVSHELSKHRHLARAAGFTSSEHVGFGSSLTVKGGILTVADDLLKNDGKKFLDMMERFAERRMQREEEISLEQGEELFEEGEEDEDEYGDEDDEETRTEEQRMEEGRQMFQIFAARMFEQRVLAAYREKVARERQQRLIQELEEEEKLREERELKKLKDKEKKKDKKRQLKEQKEKERLEKEAQRKAEEALAKAEQERQRELERQKREQERLKREEERKQKMEERRRRLKEERERAAEKERRRKEKEEQERREREERERKEREERQRQKREETVQREEQIEKEAEQRQQQEANKVVPTLKEAKACVKSVKDEMCSARLTDTRKPIPSDAITKSPTMRTPINEEERQRRLMDALVGSSRANDVPAFTEPALMHTSRLPLTGHLLSPNLDIMREPELGSPIAGATPVAINALPTYGCQDAKTMSRQFHIAPIGQPRNGRRSSTTAGTIGSPIGSRTNKPSTEKSGSNASEIAASSRSSTSLASDSTNSFFSNFLFGEPSAAISIQQNMRSKGKFDRRFSTDGAEIGWTNGWTASSVLSENVHGRLFGDALIDRDKITLERAKTAYMKLNELTQTKYFMERSQFHTLVQLHRMMNDLFVDYQIDIRELYIVVSSPSSGFQCTDHAHHGLLVRYEPTALNMADSRRPSIGYSISPPIGPRSLPNAPTLPLSSPFPLAHPLPSLATTTQQFKGHTTLFSDMS
ncbi:Stress response protein nst1 [Apophysomyces ossiformis]|uniref:Stress response protein NST1 n=1 Tax=Apophysomyces ossiformis TaxID=679940 RepID=A0A8H7ET85_9FUNG|nr:Stress response protein nst1 [Apophysomyces ossiformis]